ncbi:Response regulator receiver domain-containing protein [Pseudarcicella hirudinis]|uniref:Response regulator receiver domain-containing protein n=1 Tax=Pseudarcicella hirudinis TaxID=1079859 RepID=A0A1I5TLG7_9BACT|nr:response regulator [Pseudarcicella hirudinis]SFP83818.1 Response regulator receiver domain-containing protein [Pseudarcicella hirudinis]
MTLTCLIVEDEPLARQLLEHYAQQTKDFKLLGSYSNVSKAFEALQNLQFDVDIIFLDLQLKQHLGLDLLDKTENQNLYVIVTSAYPQSLLSDLKIQCFEWLQKPISYEIFLESVERIKTLKS